MNKNFWTKAEIAIKRFWFKITGQKRKYFRVGKCLRCGKCCRNIGILLEGKKIKKMEQFEELVKKEPEYKIFKAHGKAQDGTIIFSCTKQNGNLCSMHDKRPEICRDYPDLYLMYTGAELMKGCGYTLIPPYDFEEIFAKDLKKSEEEN